MPSSEFVEWMEFYQMEPFGSARGDMQAGIIASTAIKLATGQDPPPIGRFILNFDRPEGPQSPEALIAKLQAVRPPSEEEPG